MYLKSIILLLISISVFTLPAKAIEVCKVTDPTGTPLNVRDSPNGKIINTLRNNRDVDILDIAFDEQDRSWAKVGGYYEGRYRVWGWVIREFISCFHST